MIRLFIVEDERVIRNGIKRHVPWESLGVTRVCTAANADEFFELCESEGIPDIILSDIRMPGMNGIELCGKFREKAPESPIIFISGYSDKEYLKAAISLGAVNYLEKPLDIEEVCEAVRKAVASVHKMDRQKTNFIHLLLHDDVNQEDAVALFEHETSLKNDSCFSVSILRTKDECGSISEFYPYCSDILRENAGDKHMHCIMDTLDSHTYVILISCDEFFDTSTEIRMYSAIMSGDGIGNNIFLGIGRKVKCLEQIPESYATAVEAVKALAYKGWNTYVFWDEQRMAFDHELLTSQKQQLFSKVILSRDVETAVGMVDEWYEMLIQSHAVMNFYVKNLFFKLDHMVTAVDKSVGLESSESENNVRFLDGAQTISEMKAYVCRHIRLSLEENNPERKNHFLIKQVIDYMLKNYNDSGLSINRLADEVYLTPTYLSSLFKKKMGVTIGQYLTELRLKKAEELLRRPELKLYHVSEFVGYEDANYFAKIFKKKYGVSPSEYRENLML